MKTITVKNISTVENDLYIKYDWKGLHLREDFRDYIEGMFTDLIIKRNDKGEISEVIAVPFHDIYKDKPATIYKIGGSK